MIVTIFLSFTDLGPVSTKISYIGIMILIAGFILRQYSIKLLGKFFTPVVNKQKNQKIIEYGPYKYIRHPSYTGLLLELSGFSLSLSNIISFIMVIFLLTPAILYRIRIEEIFLLGSFREYRDYKKTTKKLIPFLY